MYRGRSAGWSNGAWSKTPPCGPPPAISGPQRGPPRPRCWWPLICPRRKRCLAGWLRTGHSSVRGGHHAAPLAAAGRGGGHRRAGRGRPRPDRRPSPATRRPAPGRRGQNAFAGGLCPSPADQPRPAATRKAASAAHSSDGAAPASARLAEGIPSAGRTPLTGGTPLTGSTPLAGTTPATGASPPAVSSTRPSQSASPKPRPYPSASASPSPSATPTPASGGY